MFGLLSATNSVLGGVMKDAAQTKESGLNMTGSIPIPSLTGGGSSASATSGFGTVTHGDIIKGVSGLMFVASLLITGFIVWKIAK